MYSSPLLDHLRPPRHGHPHPHPPPTRPLPPLHGPQTPPSSLPLHPLLPNLPSLLHSRPPPLPCLRRRLLITALLPHRHLRSARTMSSSRHHLLGSPASSFSASHPPDRSPSSPAVNGGFACLCLHSSSETDSIRADLSRTASFQDRSAVAGLPTSILADLSPSAAPCLPPVVSEPLVEVSSSGREQRPALSRSTSGTFVSHSRSLSQLDVSQPAFERFQQDLGKPAYELLEPWEVRFSMQELNVPQVANAIAIDGGVVRQPSIATSDRSFDVHGGEADVKAKERVVYINNPRRTTERGDVVNNKVRTSKYTFLTFIPKNLFEQFRRLAYIYFLAIVILNQIPQLAVFGRTASLFPLLFVLVVTAIKDGYEDWGRRKSDIIENNRMAQVFYEGQFRPKKWKRIQVGEVVKVDANNPIPCDMVLLGTSDLSGVAYIQTINLDGESNLKTRYARQETHLKHPELNPVAGIVKCEPPTRNIYEFTAYMDLDGTKIPLGPSNVILRGSELKNTSWIVAVVVYAGQETKVMQNSSGAQSKRSKLELLMNRATMWLTFFLLVICSVGGMGMGLWVSRHSKELNVLPYYHKLDVFTGLNVDYYSTIGEAAFAFLSFIIMFQVMIPISLYISMEIVRLGQSVFMNRDLEMYHSGSDTRFACRALNINEDLGQIKYVFSDKTGTLTENKMEFHAASIDGVDYSDAVVNFGSQEFLKDVFVKGEPPWRPKIAAKLDLKLSRVLQSPLNTTEKKAVHDFFLVLAACNTVVPIKVKQERPEKFETAAVETMVEFHSLIEYQGESPDEQALVSAAASYGYILLERTSGYIILDILGEIQRFEILGLHEFDSVRKRMSVVVRCPDKAIKVLVKGADAAVLDLVARPVPFALDSAAEKHRSDVMFSTLTHLDRYAREGLRTLVVAVKDLSEAEFEEWELRYTMASTSLTNRMGMLRTAAEIVENNLALLGATGIEDKLQEGVPETIAALREAGIKVWVLTGDKQETAISIGFSSRLLSHDMEKIVISATTPQGCKNALMKGRQSFLHLQRNSDSFGESLQVSPASSGFFSSSASFASLLSTNGQRSHRDPAARNKAKPPLALIIDGNTLVHALTKDVEQELFDLATACEVVICCRVAPSQKANIVSLIKDKAQEMTLAIGDGANDVPMIQRAHVGIGISGQEGRQAVMSSDFAMGQFRFLKRLLLVHGHWNYHRIAYMVLYNFYRNAVFVMMLFWYILHTAFSPSSAIFDWNLVFYSLVYTSIPTILVGIFDKDINHTTILLYPPLYGAGQRSESYTSSLFWITMLDMLWQSLVLFYVPFFTYRESTIDIWGMGSLWTIAVVILVNLHLAMDVQRWTWITHLAVWGSIALTFCCLLILDAVTEESFLPHYGIIYHIAKSSDYWLDIFLIVVLALLPRLCVKAVRQQFWPSDIQIAREAEIKGTLKIDPYTSELTHVIC